VKVRSDVGINHSYPVICDLFMTIFILTDYSSVAYPGILFGGEGGMFNKFS